MRSCWTQKSIYLWRLRSVFSGCQTYLQTQAGKNQIYLQRMRKAICRSRQIVWSQRNSVRLEIYLWETVLSWKLRLSQQKTAGKAPTNQIICLTKPRDRRHLQIFVPFWTYGSVPWQQDQEKPFLIVRHRNFQQGPYIVSWRFLHFSWQYQPHS